VRSGYALLSALGHGAGGFLMFFLLQKD